MDQKEILAQEVDRYLQGEMEENERVVFETRLTEDEEARKEVELQKLIIIGVRKGQLKKIIQKEEEAIKEEKIIQTKLVRKWISIGSLAIAASFSGIFYLGYLNNCSNLADRYYVAYANVYELPSRGGETLHTTQADSLFFDALKQLENGHNRGAAKQLITLQNKPAELHATTENAVKWYLSLAYLKSGQKGKAKELLKHLIEKPSGEFYSEAKKLLKDIES
jgi:hypothetical protein